LSRVFWAVLILTAFFMSCFAPAEARARQAATGDKALKPVEREELAPGITCTIRRDKQNLDGEELVVYMLEVDINATDVEILPVTGGERFGDAETVGDMARKYGAVGAVNGGFFYSFGDRRLPVGNLVIEGTPLAVSDYLVSSAALTTFNDRLQFLCGYFNFRLTVGLAGQTFPASTVNSASTIPGIHLYSEEWGSRLAGDGASLNVSLSRDGENVYRVAAAGTGQLEIPPGGMALRFTGTPWQEIRRALVPGEPVHVHFEYDRDYWGEIEHLITAGPLLVEEGRPVFQAVQEGFTGSILLPNSRTAMGVDKKGNVLLVVAESAVTGSRVGLTFEEMSLLMVELGAVEAVGLDGGGSSTFSVRGKVVNHAAGRQRPVPNALMVLVGPKLFLGDSRIFPDVPPVISNGRILVPVRVIMESLGAAVEWDGEAKAVSIAGRKKVIKLTIDSNEAFINGKKVFLDVPPQIVNGRTMIPVRFVTENLQGNVHWEAAERSVYINIPH